MVLYKCLTCLKEFKKKSHYITHTQNKKKPCEPNEPKINQNLPNLTFIHQNLPNLTNLNENLTDENINTLGDNKSNNITCVYCLKAFVNIYTLKRHLEGRCKVKKLDDKKKDEIFNRLLENENKVNNIINNFENLQKVNDNKVNNIINNFENLQKENEKLKQHIKDLEIKYNNDIKKIVNKNINNTVNNNNVNIIVPSDKLVDFGKEDLSKIPYEDIIKSCTGSNITGYHILVELIKQIHFNDEFPEYQNVYMTDRNREKYMFWKNAWQLGDNIIFTELMSKPQELLSIYEELIKNDIKNKKLTVKKINDTVDRYYECEKGFNDVVDPKIKDLIYNNREKIRNNYKKIIGEIELDNIKKIDC